MPEVTTDYAARVRDQVLAANREWAQTNTEQRAYEAALDLALRYARASVAAELLREINGWPLDDINWKMLGHAEDDVQAELRKLEVEIDAAT